MSFSALRSSLLAAVAVATLAGCAALPAPSPQAPATATPEAWQATLPHEGNVAALGSWWQQFDDPLVAELVTRLDDTALR